MVLPMGLSPSSAVSQPIIRNQSPGMDAQVHRKSLEAPLLPSTPGVMAVEAPGTLLSLRQGPGVPSC